MGMERVKFGIAKMGDQSVIDRFNRISFALLCVLLIDSCLISGGRLFSIGPVSSRMILTSVIGVICIPFLVMDIKKYIRSPYAISIIGLLTLIIIGFIRGALTGQDLSFGADMLKGCLYFAWFPFLCFAVRKRKYVHLLMKIVMCSGTILTLLCVIASVIAARKNEWIILLGSFLYNRSFGLLIMVTEDIPRTLMFGVMSQIWACAFGIYFFLESSKYRWIFPVCIGFNLVGIFVSYTRGIYLGAFFAAVFLLLFFSFEKGVRKKVLLVSGSSAAVFLVIILALGVLNGTGTFSYGFFRASIGTPLQPVFQEIYERTKREPIVPGPTEEPGTIGPSDPSLQKPSNEDVEADIRQNEFGAGIRETMTQKLNELIAKNPIFGNGMGAHIDFRDGKVEMVYQDVASKVGWLGVVLLCFPFLWMVIQLGQHARRVRLGGYHTDLYMLEVVLLASTFGVMVSTYTNPYFLCALGLFPYCMAMRVFSIKDFPIEGYERL